MITQILKIDLTLGKTSERNKIENDTRLLPTNGRAGRNKNPARGFCVAK